MLLGSLTCSVESLLQRGRAVSRPEISWEPPLPGTSAFPGISLPLTLTGTKTSFPCLAPALESSTPKAAMMSAAEFSGLLSSVPLPSTRQSPRPAAASTGIISLVSSPDSPVSILSARIPFFAAAIPSIARVRPPFSLPTFAPRASAAAMAASESPQGL